MKRSLLPLLLALLAASPLAAAEMQGIKGADDRLMIAVDKAPWSAMGRLNRGGRGHCSAALVGPSLVITAAHCLWDKGRGQPSLPSALTFVAGYDRGQYQGFAKVTRTVTAPGWDGGAPYGEAMAARDWALLELAEPLGNQVGWFRLGHGVEPGETVTAAGYGQDRAFVPMAHRGCAITARLPDGLLTHDCDAVKGDSGGPILVERGGAPVLEAIHVATLTGRDGGVRGGAVSAAAFRLAAAGFAASR